MAEDGGSMIGHSYLDVNGLRLHVAIAGDGEKGAVVLLHGFPEAWYSWRHQLTALAGAGFRAVAPDFRGYGLSDQPRDPENASWDHLTADLLAILDSLSIPKAFIVGKDFGTRVAYSFAVYHPDRVTGVVTLGAPFALGNISGSFFGNLPAGFYIHRWREKGRAEADFGRFDTKTVVGGVYKLFSDSRVPVAGEDQEVMDLVDQASPLPDWLTEEDLGEYSALYERSGFRYPLQMPYRTPVKKLDQNSKIQAPTLLIMGEKDYILEFPGVEDYIRSGQMNQLVPDLEISFISEGTHFVQEQLPEEVNKLIITFFNRKREDHLNI